jgi:hypothetical protein
VEAGSSLVRFDHNDKASQRCVGCASLPGWRLRLPRCRCVCFYGRYTILQPHQFPGYDTPDKFRDEISIARSQLNCGAAERLPIGIGFLAWQLEKSPVRAHEMIAIALDNHVQAIWLAFGRNLSQHIHFIRTYESKLKRDWKVTIFIQTSSAEEASIAATEWKVDVIVAQGQCSTERASLNRN